MPIYECGQILITDKAETQSPQVPANLPVTVKQIIVPLCSCPDPNRRSVTVDERVGTSLAVKGLGLAPR